MSGRKTHSRRVVKSIRHGFRVWIVFTQWGGGVRSLSWVVTLSEIRSVGGDLDTIL